MIDLRDPQCAPGRAGRALTDIGFETAASRALEPNLVCDAPSYDADGACAAAG